MLLLASLKIQLHLTPLSTILRFSTTLLLQLANRKRFRKSTINLKIKHLEATLIFIEFSFPKTTQIDEIKAFLSLTTTTAAKT